MAALFFNTLHELLHANYFMLIRFVPLTSCGK